MLQVFCVRLRKGKEGEKMSSCLAILRLVLLVLFGLSIGGRGGNWFIFQRFQSTDVFSSPLFPSLLRLAREWLKFQTIGGTPCSYSLLC